MTPTPKLRFVERQQGYKSVYGTDSTPNMIRVLQQWWEPHWIEGNLGVPKGEWRDVPLEKENE